MLPNLDNAESASLARRAQGRRDMSRGDSVGPDSRRRAVAFCGSVLLAYVGIVHDVVGSTLYPDGPGEFGGPVGWYGAGLGLTATGLLMAAATLGILRAPVVPLAAVVSIMGAIVFVGSAIQDEHFHFFAFTMLAAGAAVIASARGGQSAGGRPGAEADG